MVTSGGYREEPCDSPTLKIRSTKAKISMERNPDKHSLEAVGILKQAMDKEDKYLIYKIK